MEKNLLISPKVILPSKPVSNIPQGWVTLGAGGVITGYGTMPRKDAGKINVFKEIPSNIIKSLKTVNPRVKKAAWINEDYSDQEEKDYTFEYQNHQNHDNLNGNEFWWQ